MDKLLDKIDLNTAYENLDSDQFEKLKAAMDYVKNADAEIMYWIEKGLPDEAAFIERQLRKAKTIINAYLADEPFDRVRLHY